MMSPTMVDSAFLADLESCQRRVGDFSTYCDNLVQTVEDYSKRFQKKRGRKKAQPVLLLPPRPSGLQSLQFPHILGDTVVVAGPSGLPPIPSGDEQEPDGATRGNRTRRTAAVKAIAATKTAFLPVHRKLRRPTDFSPRSGSIPVSVPVVDGLVPRALDFINATEALSTHPNVADEESHHDVPPNSSMAPNKQPSEVDTPMDTGDIVSEPKDIKVSATNEENTVAPPPNPPITKGISEESSSRMRKKEKDEGLRKKEEDAFHKKQELINLKKEELRKIRTQRIKKVAETRAAVEKEKLLQLEREKKEREEKERQAMIELQRKKEEEIAKKKLLNQQKAQEAEERRIRKEKERLARLKEQEEEQRRAAEARQRQMEEAERLAVLRRNQEKEEELQRALEKERREKEKARLARAVPSKDDPDDFGIDDTDGDETAPRRPNPKWANQEELQAVLFLQSYFVDAGVPIGAIFESAPVTPDLDLIFGHDAVPRTRTSSQFWPKTPPQPQSNLAD